MLRISTFGRLALDDETGPVGGVGSWRPTLAALALLAASGEQGVPRERLLSMLWPESAPERARNSLKQLLSALRRTVPGSAIPGTTLLRLDHATVSCDLWDFQSALARGDLETAVTLYAGPFLDGFSLTGAVEFERWAEGERVRLTGEFHRALETLAERATAAGEHRTAVNYMRRLAVSEPLNSDVALRLMLTLVASGNRAGALQHFDIHAALVQQELECVPDPAIVEYASVLRAIPRVAVVAGVSPRAGAAETRTSRVPSHSGRPADERTGAPTLRLVSDDATTDAPPASLSSAASSASSTTVSDSSARVGGSDVGTNQHPPALELAPTPSPRWRHRSLVAGSVATGVVLGFTVFGLFSRVGRPQGGVVVESANASIGTTSVVAVMPFSVQGRPALEHLGDGLADLLSSRLDGAGTLRSVDSRVILKAAQADFGRAIDQRTARTLARRLDARFFVVGSVVEIAGRLRIAAYLFDRDGGRSPVARADVETVPDGVFAAADDLAARLLADRFRAPAERLSRAAALTTQSIPALKAFLGGETALREGRLNDAAVAYRRATATDSTFALAHYRASQVAQWTGRDEAVLPAAELALRFADRLSSQDSLLVRAFVEWRKGRLDDAERLYRGEVDDHPDDVEGWFQLGELLFHDNPLRGRSSTEARTPFQRVLALDPDDGESLVHLARIAYSQGRRAEVDSLMRRVLALAPERDVLELRAFRAFALGDPQGQKRVTNELLAAPGSVPAVTALEVAVYADDLSGAERFGARLTDDEHSTDVRGFGHRLLAQTAAARGQWRAAQRELTASARLDSIAALELRAQLVVLPFLPVSRAEQEATRAALLAWHPATDESEDAIHFKAHLGLHPSLRAYFLGLVSVRLGDTAAALAHARELETGHDAVTRSTVAFARATFARSIRARVADAAGEPERALELLTQAEWQPIASDVMIEALDRYYRAELLRRLGRADEARGWYASMAQRATYELPYLAPSHLQLAKLAEARGDEVEARRHYRGFVDSWRTADAGLRPLGDDATRHLAALGR
jgi:DNA-binding SARP family transcriptional activator/tetratricopeptide (TPR) repeat protein